MLCSEVSSCTYLNRFSKRKASRSGVPTRREKLKILHIFSLERHFLPIYYTHYLRYDTEHDFISYGYQDFITSTCGYPHDRMDQGMDETIR